MLIIHYRVSCIAALAVSYPPNFISQIKTIFVTFSAAFICGPGKKVGLNLSSNSSANHQNLITEWQRVV